MRNEIRKDYEKALASYNNGELEKALKYCEIGIAKDLKNSDLLNLKGLIFYIRGNLKEAIAIWKINKACNADFMAESYIKDSQEDEERVQLFKEAQKQIKALYIDKAIELLMLCLESDFNSIQINNTLAICYLKKGEIEKCREYLNKAISIDRHDKTSASILKELEIYNQDKKPKYIVPIVISIAVVIFIGFIGLKVIRKEPQNNETLSENTQLQDKENTEKKETQNNEELAQNKKEDKIEEIKEEPKAEKIQETPLTLAEVQEYYGNATAKFKQGDYLGSKELLDKAVKYSSKSDLNDDILFFLASANEKLGDTDNAIKNFEEYISLYEKGNYTEEVYYKLALLNKDKNKEKSKKYANKLVYNYPGSIYNNTNIDSILKN